MGLLLAPSVSFGQKSPSVLIGVDVLKPVFSAVGPAHNAYRLAEATVKIPLSTTYLSIVGGYAGLRSDTIFRNIRLHDEGYYLKVGVERIGDGGLVLGWHGLVSSYRQSGTYFFKGTTFGDYESPIPDLSNLAIGLEGILGHQTALSPRFLLRFTGRVTTAAIFGTKDGGVPPYFVPGIGHVAGNSLVYSVGVGIHLFYQLHPRPTATSLHD
ncbi:hypothetical protein SAMN06269250_3576 [Spirosoma fluviale]|uniref:Outer membrane protein beta-barrel domain-containing protein n=2 Tax=Spirosoma fluviale TaxID=1597977 RepID=A0A286G803_9BACT|nr:hypothetical protein SAMN06269250_3576 [Spirosoma fluviale]